MLWNMTSPMTLKCFLSLPWPMANNIFTMFSFIPTANFYFLIPTANLFKMTIIPSNGQMLETLKKVNLYFKECGVVGLIKRTVVTLSAPFTNGESPPMKKLRML